MTVDATALQGGGAGPGADALDTAFGDGGGPGAELGGDVHEVSVGPGGSLTSDVALFGDSLEAARLREVPAVSPVAEVMMEPLGAIDREAAELAGSAEAAVTSGNELTPAEILELTVRSQEFMFHSQLTANIANRTADGLQQLFRQQG